MDLCEAKNNERRHPNCHLLQLLPMCMIIIIVAMSEKQGAIFKLQRRYLEFKTLIIFT